MEKTLLVIERIVIESLDKKTLHFDELTEQTGLDEFLLQAVLGELIQKGIVKYKSFSYELNWEMKDHWLPIVTDREGTKAEIKELFAALVNQIYAHEGQSTLKMQKVYLNQREKDELERRLNDIDVFVQGIRNQRKIRPVKEVTSEQQVLFYGTSPYKSLVNSILKVG